MPVTLVPFFWPDFFLRSSHLTMVRSLASASFWKALVSGPASLPILLFESGALIYADGEAVDVQLRAALSIIGSTTETNWFSPGPRWAPTGTVLVSTGTLRNRIASG